MALVSRQFEVMQAIRSAIVADTDISAVIPAASWIIQKRPWSRNRAWIEGALICALDRQKPAHENSVVKIICPTLVALTWPSDGSLVGSMNSEMALMERIEQIFEFKGRTNAPAPLRALDALHSDRNKYVFQHCFVQPGAQFTEGALRAGFDSLACVITVEIQAVKTDESALGA